jgi:hypothetical protein
MRGRHCATHSAPPQGVTVTLRKSGARPGHSVGNLSLTLYHGTTLAAATAIMAEGWRPVDVDAIVDAVAIEHGMDPADVRAELRSLNRYATSEGRGAWASFSSDRELTIHSWAQRAPEAKWDTLWSVWRLRHPEDLPDWNLSTRGHVWVWDQMRTDRLAVLEWETSYDEIVALGAYSHGFRKGPLPDAALLQIPGAAWEVGFDVPFTPSRDRLSLIEVDRHVDWQMFAHLLGMTEEEFIARANANHFAPPIPAPRDPSIGGPRPWWPTDYVLDYLARTSS